MKKFLLIVISFVFIAGLQACPICGCGVGNFYMGLLPDFKTKFIGVRYQYMRYHTQIAGDAEQFGNDYYKTAEIWGGFNLGKKWQVLAFIPYHFNKQITDDGIINKNGLGDVTTLVNYNLFHKQNMNMQKRSLHSQDILIGAGVKLPTGKYHLDLDDPEIELGDVNSQLGTGSVDFLLNAAYNVRMNDFGINTSLNYKINTTNSEKYNFGNRFSANGFGYYNITANAFSVSPNIGLLYETTSGNHLQGKIVEETGGYAAFAASGIELSYKKITVGTNVQIPVAQNFAHGQTTAKLRGMLHVSFAM